MPSPFTGRSSHRSIVLLESPREAAERARVYRRQLRQKPRDRLLRLIALLGSLFVHLIVLIGVVLAPVYVPELPPEHFDDALQVRFIAKKKEEPPPPPPILGTPPKQRGPVHRGRSAFAVARPLRSTEPTLPAVPAPAPIPVPTIEPPVVDTSKHTAVPKPDKVVAATVPPVAVPKPAPTPELQPVPLTGEPPTVTLDTPPVAKPVPPKFQPEPPRKPQPEGNRPIPPPPSLAMPELPAQAAPTVAPPTVALDTRVPVSKAPASVVVARPEVSAAPPVPELQPVPLPAQAAPTVNLAPQLQPPTPVVATERPQIQAPTLTVAPAEPELEAVPVAPRAPSLIEQPTPPAMAAPRVDTPAPQVTVTVARPELPTDTPEQASPQPPAAPAAPTPASETAASTPAPAETPTAPAATKPGERDVSTAPHATPQGSDTANPGVPNGAPQAPLIGKDGSIVLPAPGQGSGNRTGGTSPEGAQQGAEGGERSGRLGEYIQLKPHGDTQIMEHRAPNIGYKPTRFEQDWAPEGESSIDTALRHAVEKTTVRHTFHLPRGVRIECVALPLLPMALLGCHNPDPPAKPLDPAIYQRLNMAATPLAPPPPPPATVVPPPSAAPIQLDNSVQCASARVSGGPLPPGCATATTTPPRPASPAPSSSSWVPASDQF